MLTEIVVSTACVLIVLVAYSYLVMQPKQRELTERARINAARYGGAPPASGGLDSIEGLMAHPMVQPLIQKFLENAMKPKE